MPLKIFIPLLLIFAFASCGHEAPKDTFQVIDPGFVKGLRSMKDRANDCSLPTAQKKTSRIEISTEGNVSDSITMCIIMDQAAGNNTGCMQVVYFGPYAEEITTDPYYAGEKDQYYFNVRLLDTVKWVSYSWAPDVSMRVKDEMKMHLRYDANVPNQIEFD